MPRMQEQSTDESQVTDEEREQVQSAIPALLAHDAKPLLNALENTLRRHLTVSEWSSYEGMSNEEKRTVLETVAEQFPELKAVQGKQPQPARASARSQRR